VTSDRARRRWSNDDIENLQSVLLRQDVLDAKENLDTKNSGLRRGKEVFEPMEEGKVPARSCRIWESQSAQTVDTDVGTYAASVILSTKTHNNAEDSKSYIPSESSIKVAKEKRGRLRQTQATGEEDFISLSAAKLEDGPKGSHPESRLMREEDELGEGDDGKPCTLLPLISLYTSATNL